MSDGGLYTDTGADLPPRDADNWRPTDADICTCNYVAMPSMLTGRTTYVPGRRDPNCPTHPRDGAA